MPPLFNKQIPEIILGSASPRRKELLKKMGFSFTSHPVNIDESYPINLPAMEVAGYISKMKMLALFKVVNSDNKILLTADTTVCFENKIIGKPKNRDEAFSTLKTLSGKMHTVVSSCMIKFGEFEDVFSEKTIVYFNEISDKEITHYIDNHQPYDKAGSYGIQDWIGVVGIHKIDGSYNNVVGLPTDILYHKLINI